MRSRQSAWIAGCLALGVLGLFVPGASARPKPVRLVALKACNTVLVAADLRDELEELGKPEGSAGIEASTCLYGGLDEGGAAGSPTALTEGKLGVKCIDNILILAEAHIPPPPTGCFRMATATLVVAHTRAVERVARKLKKGVRARYWPAGFGRQILHGVGDRAEFGFAANGRGWGYLQVLNAQLTVETSEGGVLTVLQDAARLL
jgi:hypothetical protein